MEEESKNMTKRALEQALLKRLIEQERSMRLAREIEEKEDAITNMENVIWDEFQVFDKEVAGSEEPVKTFADTKHLKVIWTKIADL